MRISDARKLAEALTQLNKDYAEILTLKYYYDFKDMEIADALNISHENVRTRLHRARKALLKLMTEHDIEEKEVSI